MSSVPEKQDGNKPNRNSQTPAALNDNSSCLPKDWQLNPCAVLWLAVFMVSLATFLTGFSAPYWRENDNVTHSGLWKICAYEVCYNYVGDSRIQKGGK